MLAVVCVSVGPACVYEVFWCLVRPADQHKTVTKFFSRCTDVSCCGTIDCVS